MKIQFSEIPPDGLQVSVTDKAWFPENEFPLNAALKVGLYLERQQERVLATGSIETAILSSCDRCLEEFSLPLLSRFRIVFECTGPDQQCETEDHLSGSDETDVICLEEPEIDVGQLLTQQVYLTVPVKKVCSEDCLGLCPECGGNRNQRQCDCSKSNSSSPFSILKDFKK